MADKRNGKSLVVGAVVGSVLGAVAALLTAPKSGRELRRDISAQYGKASERTVKIANRVGTKTQEVAGVITGKSQVIAGAVGTRSQKLARTVSTHATAAFDKAKETAGTVAEEVKAWKNGRKSSGSSQQAAVEAETEQAATALADETAEPAAEVRRQEAITQ